MNCKKIHERIDEWLKAQAIGARAKGFVVGVSGGVDSGLVSTLCAMTGLETHLIQMPIHRTPGPISERAEKHCNWLKDKFGVKTYVHDMSEVMDAMLKTFPETMTELAAANLRSRLRMCSLYTMSNTKNCMVVGTGNLIEDFGIGFCTKFGDSGVDLSPIGELFKSQVRELANYLGVSTDIVLAVPTDELWRDGRSDESQIGSSYEELEWAYEECEPIQNPEDGFIFPEDVPSLPGYELFTERQKQTLDIYIRRHNTNLHKNKMPPVCHVQDILMEE